MREKFHFAHDPGNDVVTAAFDDVVLSTVDDATQWEREASEILGGYGRKVDLLIDLSGLHVKSGAARAFGDARARVLSTYTRCSARFGADEQTQAFIFTSAVINDTAANVFATRDEALAWLLRRRARG